MQEVSGGKEKFLVFLSSSGKAGENVMEKDEPFVLDVNGTQVFSADFIFEQMQAQSRRIDRAEAKSAITAIIAIFSLVFNIILLCG